jgi:hypothetical protein
MLAAYLRLRSLDEKKPDRKAVMEQGAQMPTDLDKVIAKLGDKGVQNRIQSAIRNATFNALKKEGIELSPAEWGELTARAIAAKTDTGVAGWTDYIGPIASTMGALFFGPPIEDEHRSPRNSTRWTAPLRVLVPGFCHAMAGRDRSGSLTDPSRSRCGG